MYQRSYYPNEEPKLCPPREYDGSLCFEKEEKKETPADCTEPCCTEKAERTELPVLGRIQSLLGGFELGLEEILIIGAAIFLFMSKSGDFECIFILIALLFIR